MSPVANPNPAEQFGISSNSGLPADHPVTAGDEHQPLLPRFVVPAVLAIIAILTIVAYSPVLFNFFAGDDFVHLTWLKQAVSQPELIWRNFHSSWLDGTTTKFYRPLISVFMVSDYVLWRGNGLGFHITNLVFHLASAVILFFIVRGLALKELPGSAGFQPASSGDTLNSEQAGSLRSRVTVVWPVTLWALTAAAIFALYPLHTEAVSWITGRVDAIVTTFCLASFWCYIRWRTRGGLLWCAGSIFSFICGLLSKEMAITIPALFVMYEVLYAGGTELKSKFISAARGTLATLPFWAVLAVYFAVRRLALGTFVGGYDDSLLFIADPKSFIENWLHALRMFVEPLNRSIVGARHPLTHVWEVLLGCAAISGAIRLWRRDNLRTVLFITAWLALALAPVYKLFAIADDLQGSRLAYLATVPLSVLLAYGITGIRRIGANSKPLSAINIAIPLFCAVSCCSALFINNQAWHRAGIESNAIRSGLDRIYRNISGDPQVMFLGLPDQIDGAYVSRNALYGMTKSPQISRDAYNNVAVNDFEVILPFGYLKDSLAENRDGVRIFRWSSEDKQFHAVQINHRRTDSRLEFTGISSDLHIHCGTEHKRPFVSFSLPSSTSPWDIDFVQLDVEVAQTGKYAGGADLLYATGDSPDFKLANRTHTDVTPQLGALKLNFALRSLPTWALSNGQPQFKLLMPIGSSWKINSIGVVPARELMPLISFSNSGYSGTKGYMHFDPKVLEQTLLIDASAVQGARSTLLEMTRPNMCFEQQNCQSFSKVRGKLLPGPLTGKVHLTHEQFPALGLYELRAWALDSSGKPIGVASDHIAISVDP